MGMAAASDFLTIHPAELKFPFELRKQSSCSIQLSNKTDRYVAFKVKTTNPTKYGVRPNAAIIRPGSVCSVTVTMRPLRELPPGMQCKDMFLIESVDVHDGAMVKDINQEMFNKGDGKVIGEFKLRVAYITANPPSPVPEEPEEDSSSVSSSMDDVDKSTTISEAAWSTISKLIAEKGLALQQNQKLCQELDMMRERMLENHDGDSFSWLFVVLVGLFGILVGYLIKMMVI